MNRNSRNENWHEESWIVHAAAYEHVNVCARARVCVFVQCVGPHNLRYKSMNAAEFHAVYNFKHVFVSICWANINGSRRRNQSAAICIRRRHLVHVFTLSVQSERGSIVTENKKWKKKKAENGKNWKSILCIYTFFYRPFSLCSYFLWITGRLYINCTFCTWTFYSFHFNSNIKNNLLLLWRKHIYIHM